MKKITLMFCFIPTLAIMGCATQYEFSHKTAYVNQPHLQVVPGLSGSKMTEDYYPIPGAPIGDDVRQPVSLIPPGSHFGESARKK